jgi:hypothetical protein
VAYKSELRRICQEERCDSAARWQVYTNRNGFVGTYCTQHANAKVRAVNGVEALETKAEKAEPE